MERYCNRGMGKQDPDDLLYNEAIDETVTVDTVALTDSDSEAKSSTEEVSSSRVCGIRDMRGPAAHTWNGSREESRGGYQVGDGELEWDAKSHKW